MPRYITVAITIAAVLTFATVTRAQSRPGPPRLIVRGDDMGYSHAGNEAILKCYREGIETSIEVIVP